MLHLQPPHRSPLDLPVVFLAGSIEQNRAERWQEKLTQALSGLNVIVANPRRDAWDATWDQSEKNPVFTEQVNWELDHLEAASVVFFYFDPATKSPISLLELGKILETHAAGHIIVCCPSGFWRKGNVDICCARKGVKVYTSLENATAALVAEMSTAVLLTPPNG